MRRCRRGYGPNWLRSLRTYSLASSRISERGQYAETIPSSAWCNRGLGRQRRMIAGSTICTPMCFARRKTSSGRADATRHGFTFGAFVPLSLESLYPLQSSKIHTYHPENLNLFLSILPRCHSPSTSTSSLPIAHFSRINSTTRPSSKDAANHKILARHR